jgi:hypothetical protein
MSGWNQDEFKRALDFAARAHGEQKVPGSGFPYLVHLTKVATENLEPPPAHWPSDKRTRYLEEAKRWNAISLSSSFT